jgi:purine nucleosidase/pyrimidine-specific ribonucleoside hydrolase
MTRIIIDTDPGQDIDDLLAIHFALLRPELEVLAVTTATWPSAGRGRLVKRLLRHLGRDDVPVGAGMQLPLRRVDEAEMRQQRNPAWSMNHACFAEPVDPADAPQEDGVGLMIRTLLAAPGPVSLCCIAPLTNLACALTREPDIAAKIDRILLMGGETALNRCEHNIGHDPVAADLVLSAGIPVVMGTWDVTRRFVLGDADCARFAASPLPLHRDLARAITAWHPAQAWKPGPVMYDIFPMIHAFDPSFYATTEMPVRVVTAGEGRGMTVTGAGTRMQVTTGMREREVRELYLATVFAD